MNTARQQIDDASTRVLAAAPIGRRFGALLLDSAAALFLVFSGSKLLSLAYQQTPPWFVAVFLAVYQVCVLSWTLGRDSWWRGQGIGKRAGAVLVVDSHTHRPASRLRCIWRQAIFVFIVLALYLPAYLYFTGPSQVIGWAVASSLISVAAPVRLVVFLLPDQAKTAGDMVLAHFLVMGFLALEALLVFSRSDRRRIIDFLAGTQVVDAKSAQQT
jgi:uncharacterized RDD family membrane protein YckC